MRRRALDRERRAPKLLVSVRGKNEALTAASAGAHIADVEYPASALGTPYPLNILAVRETLSGEGFGGVKVSTNIGEIPRDRASSCQQALGVTAAGADLVKFGVAQMSLDAAVYFGSSLVRTLRHWYPEKMSYPAVFVDPDLQLYLEPLRDGPSLVRQIDADGLLVDTFNKVVGKGLLDYMSLEDVSGLVTALHEIGKEAWVAGSITLDELPGLWATGVDVICVRGAACTPGKGSERFGEVDYELVRSLVATIPA